MKCSYIRDLCILQQVKIIFSSFFQSIKIVDASLDDQGSYECKVVDHSGNSQAKSEFVRILEKEEPFLRIWSDSFSEYDVDIDDPSKQKSLQWVVKIESHPKPTVVW